MKSFAEMPKQARLLMAIAFFSIILLGLHYFGIRQIFQGARDNIPFQLQVTLGGEARRIEGVIESHVFLAQYLASLPATSQFLSWNLLKPNEKAIITRWRKVVQESFLGLSQSFSEQESSIEEIRLVSSNSTLLFSGKGGKTEIPKDPAFGEMLSGMALAGLNASECAKSQVVAITREEGSRRIMHIGVPVQGPDKSSVGHLVLGVNLENLLSPISGLTESLGGKTALVSADGAQSGVFLVHPQANLAMNAANGIGKTPGDDLQINFPTEAGTAEEVIGKLLKGDSPFFTFYKEGGSEYFLASFHIRTVPWVLFSVVDTMKILKPLKKAQTISMTLQLVGLLLMLLAIGFLIKKLDLGNTDAKPDSAPTIEDVARRVRAAALLADSSPQNGPETDSPGGKVDEEPYDPMSELVQKDSPQENPPSTEVGLDELQQQETPEKSDLVPPDPSLNDLPRPDSNPDEPPVSSPSTDDPRTNTPSMAFRGNTPHPGDNPEK